MNNPKSTLGQKWINFLNAVFSPVPIFSLLGGLGLLYLSVHYKDDGRFSILINLAGSLLIGIGGAFIKDRYVELSNESILIKKGQSAVRNLESIAKQIEQIRSWLKFFISSKTSDKRDLEEINRHLSTTEMNIASGLADWIDIVPELNKKAEEMAEKAKSYEEVVKTYVEELFKNKKKLLEVGENKKLKERLQESIKNLEKEVRDLKKYRPEFTASGIISSSSFGSNGNGLSYLNRNSLARGLSKTCSNCGRVFEDDINRLTIGPDLCEECRKTI
ncbi:MAG: hypothetical protein WCV59_00895 [Parcubacteria group bacterium]|jgi:hypothetical protein